MNTRNKISALIESALITAIAVVFTLIGLYIPFLTILLMFMPLPFIIIGAKNGFKYCILSLVAATIIIGSLTDPLTAMFFLIIGGLTSILIVYMIQKKYSFTLIIFFGSIALTVSVIISFALFTKVIGLNPLEILENNFARIRDIYKGFSGIPSVDSAQLDQMLKLLDQMTDLILLIFPSIIIITCVFTTYINYIVSGAILRKIGFAIGKPNKLSYFKLPSNFIMGTLVIVILTLVANKFNIIKSDALNINIGILFQEIFTLQGLAVVSFFLQKNKLRDVSRRIILVLIYFIPIAKGISFFLGFFDVIFNVRKLEI
ncbi:YybS family protein [Paramaledivibacter caminithermalis]|uniref:Uncharacterized conserved protein YybS, DUF2232 family n=1 Tax=Paramaledivibacter caminithermalis (strain DSM 15212 / CIP 107654 / DViRD3) TaxID=1121301 RepID=A0A1M6NCU0_PARC5|nr:DUF2232 domain-containing protein [Paramaledivibacter caminithermalis]SHJ93558.1 Uncharacterized conserved protein YybS, DUF2232 family [Paramaledivibacter caminithermalis DSM 15212]